MKQLIDWIYVVMLTEHCAILNIFKTQTHKRTFLLKIVPSFTTYLLL